MVEGRPDKAHRPGQVREDLIPNNKRTGPAEPRLDWPIPTDRCNGAHPRIAATRTMPTGNDSHFNAGRLPSDTGIHSGGKQRKANKMTTTAEAFEVARCRLNDDVLLGLPRATPGCD